VSQLQKVLDALEDAKTIDDSAGKWDRNNKAIAIVRGMMQAEPIEPMAAVVEVRRTNGPWQRYDVYSALAVAEDTRRRVEGDGIEARVIPLYQATQVPIDPFEKYLKEGETPIQRLEREIKDGRALMTVYGKALGQIQELQQQQDTPVAFYDIAHDEDGEIEYEFSAYPRPGFRPLFAQAIAAAPKGAV
jgi:hypothetical protein